MENIITWKHNFTNYSNLDNINNHEQHLKIFQPLPAKDIRFQLNNLYDDIPLEISNMTIYTDSFNKQTVTLNNQAKFKVNSRLTQWSDWINFNLPAKSFLSIYIESPTKIIHSAGLTISNDLIQIPDSISESPKYFFGISSIQIKSPDSYKRMAFFGDSLTNQGNFTAPLALDLESNFNIMTANYGISGNRLLHQGHSDSQWSNSFGEAGYTRFDHMLVNYRPNIVLFMEGINDLIHPGTENTPLLELPSAGAITQAVLNLKTKCDLLDIIFIPMTITPAKGNEAWNDTKEELRLEINSNLLKFSNTIDLASFVSNGNHLHSKFDCGDHVHFSQIGGQLISKYIKEQLIIKKLI